MDRQLSQWPAGVMLAVGIREDGVILASRRQRHYGEVQMKADEARDRGAAALYETLNAVRKEEA